MKQVFPSGIRNFANPFEKATIVKINSRGVKLFFGAPKRLLSTPLGRRYNQSMDAHHFLKVGKKNHHGSGEGLTTKEDSDGFSY